MTYEASPAGRAELPWLASRAPCVLSPSARGIKVTRGPEIVAMVAYDDWTPNSCQAHMASTSAIAWRKLLPHVFSYPFEELGRGLILGTVRGDNTRSLQMAFSLGFREQARVHDGWARGVDLVLIQMRREECGWLGRAREAA